MQKKKNEGEALYGELGQAFNFTQGDLEANRAGFISARQQQILRRNLLPSCIFLALLPVGLTPLIALFWSLFDNVANESSIFVWITIILVSIPFWVLIPWGLFAIVDSLREFGVRRVVKYVGKVNCGYTGLTRHFDYYLTFEDKRFGISEKAYRLLNPDYDKHYIIYYLPKSNDILSIES